METNLIVLVGEIKGQIGEVAKTQEKQGEMIEKLAAAHNQNIGRRSLITIGISLLSGLIGSLLTGMWVHPHS